MGNKNGGAIIFFVALIGLYFLYSSGLLGISGANPFQSGISLKPLTNLGNEAVNYISSLLGISVIMVVIIIMAFVIAKGFSKKY